MTSSYQLPSRVVKLLETYEFDGAPIWRLSEGKHGVVKLELTWQPPTQQQHKLQKKTPGRKKETTIPTADEWPRQPSPAKTPPPAVQKPAVPTPPPIQSPSPAMSSVDMISLPGTPETTPPPGTRLTPKTPLKSPPSKEEKDEEDSVYEYSDDRTESLQKYKMKKIMHGQTDGKEAIFYQLQQREKPTRGPPYATVMGDVDCARLYKPPESKYHYPDMWNICHGKLQTFTNKQLQSNHKMSRQEYWKKLASLPLL